jgi:hypothetical protein
VHSGSPTATNEDQCLNQQSFGDHLSWHPKRLNFERHACYLFGQSPPATRKCRFQNPQRHATSPRPTSRNSWLRTILRLGCVYDIKADSMSSLGVRSDTRMGLDDSKNALSENGQSVTPSLCLAHTTSGTTGPSRRARRRVEISVPALRSEGRTTPRKSGPVTKRPTQARLTPFACAGPARTGNSPPQRTRGPGGATHATRPRPRQAGRQPRRRAQRASHRR